MGISAASQALAFAAAFGLGFIFGILFDVFRFIRIAFGGGKIAVFFEDVFFWLICAVATFIFLLFETRGQLRVPLVLCIFVGTYVYYRALGSITYQTARRADPKIKRFTRKCVRKAARPIKNAGAAAGIYIIKKRKKGEALLKKENNLLAIRLKVHLKMMYNLIKSIRKPKGSE